MAAGREISPETDRNREGPIRTLTDSDSFAAARSAQQEAPGTERLIRQVPEDPHRERAQHPARQPAIPEREELRKVMQEDLSRQVRDLSERPLRDVRRKAQ